MTAPLAAPPTTAQAPRLLDRVADALRARGYVPALRQAYVDWVRRYVHFHRLRHPQELGATEVVAFLTSIQSDPELPPAADVAARAALLFLYEVVLAKALGPLPTEVGRLAEGIGGDLRPRAADAGPRFLDQLRHLPRVRHYARRTEDCYVDWARRYILFHDKRHPADLGAAHVAQFLSHLAVESTTMIYTHVMKQGVAGVRSPLELLDDLSADQVQAALDATRRLAGHGTPAAVPVG